MNGSQRIQDKRGSAAQRRRRRAWLVQAFGVEDGTVCHRCGVHLPADGDWHVDRWPRPGCRGGRYVRSNIRPSCADCNVRHNPERMA